MEFLERYMSTRAVGLGSFGEAQKRLCEGLQWIRLLSGASRALVASRCPGAFRL